MNDEMKTLRLPIQEEQDRNTMVLILAANGYPVWLEEPNSVCVDLRLSIAEVDTVPELPHGRIPSILDGE
jgi:hypothetical protein